MSKFDYWCCAACGCKVIYAGSTEPLDEGAVCFCPAHAPKPEPADVVEARTQAHTLHMQMLNALKAAETSIAAVVEMAHDSDDIDALDEVRAAIRAAGG